MEILAAAGFVIFLPILTVLPAWQRMRREAENAREVSGDVRTLLDQGDEARAISVLEQGASRLAPSVIAAIHVVDGVSFPRKGQLYTPVSNAASSIFGVVGLLLVGVGGLGFCLNPLSLLTLLLGLSMIQAGNMLAAARKSLLEAQSVLLLAVRKAA